MTDTPISTNTAKIIYILYLAGILIPFVSLVALVMAYINKPDAPEWLSSHYQFQIRTFWIGLLYSLLGIVLTMIVIGWFILVFVVIWLIIRCVKGLKILDSQQAIPDHKSWLF